jgi:hypothetical protein
VLLGLALVVEILGTVFAYQIMTTVLTLFNNSVMGATSGLTDVFGGGNGGSGLFLVLAGIILSSLFHLFYIILALRMRTAITGAIDDGISSVISRFTETRPRRLGLRAVWALCAAWRRASSLVALVAPRVFSQAALRLASAALLARQ